MLNDNEYSNLVKVYNENEDTVLIIVKGNLGIGKSYVIDHFINENQLEFLHIINHTTHMHPLQPFTNAIFDFYLRNNCERSNNLLNETLNYEMCVKKEMYHIYRSIHEIVIWFDEFEQYTNQLLDYVTKFIKDTLALKNPCKITIILECSLDKASLTHKNKIYELESMVKQQNIVSFHRKSDNKLEEFINILLNNSNSLSKSITQAIIHTAFHNPLNIIRIIGYLKEDSVLYQKENKWVCDDLDKNTLKTCVNEYITIQYNILDINQRNMVQKAAITGYEIDIELLERPLKVFDALTNLTSIGRKTDLVLYKTNPKFKTQEVYDFVLNCCDDESKIIWHRFVAEYLEHKCHRKKILYPTLESITLYSSIAFHYAASKNDEKALYNYLRCIVICRELEDYYMIKMIADKLLLCPHKIKDSDVLFWIEYNLALAEEKLGNYKNAVEYYDNVIKFFSLTQPLSLVIFLRYKLAYNLYNSGKSQESKIELLDLLKIFKAEYKDDLIHTKILDLLAAICSHFGENVQSERYYSLAVKKAQKQRNKRHYYLLMKNSGMFCTNEVALPYLKSAYEYFRDNNNEWEQALVAFNIGVSLIYLKQEKKAMEYMNISGEIFKKYNSKSIHYVINARAVICGINEDYEQALELLIVAHKAHTEFFSDVYILINQSHCYRKLGRLDECKRLLEICTEKVEKHTSNTFYLERNLAFSYGMYFYEKEEYQSAIKKIEEAFSIEKHKLHIFSYIDLFTMWLVKLTNITNLPLSDEVLKYKEATLSAYNKHLFNTKVLWGNFMFWGI